MTDDPRLLEAAREEFARHGLTGARVDAIAARTKTAKRMIYYYFGGKEQLYMAVLFAWLAVVFRAEIEALRAAKYLGRALWRRWSGYHRRSRVETKMHCMKLLGQRLMARDFDRQVAELQVRIAVLNGYTALGIPVTEAVG